jgi:hypothetical protein
MVNEKSKYRYLIETAYKNILPVLLLIVFLNTNLNSQVQRDTSDNYWKVVKPKAESRNIVFGEVFIGEYKDTLSIDFIKNTGSWKFRVDSMYIIGGDSGSFKHLSGFPVFSIESGSGYPCEFRFRPVHDGIHKADLVIITQSDTLIHTISGIGVEKKLNILNNNIDFGKVKKGEFKDSLNAVMIENISNAEIHINTINQSGDGVDVFNVLDEKAPFALSPGDTAKLDLRFSPHGVGWIDSFLEFYYAGSNLPAVVQLYGEGTENGPRIETNHLIFENLICDNFSQSELEITNTGGELLIIEKMEISGANSEEFNIDDYNDIEISPKESEIFDVYFNPENSGSKNATLTVFSNSQKTPQIEIELFGRKDSIDINPLKNVVDLGWICTLTGKDTFLILQNHGTKPVSGYILTGDNLSVSNTVFEINNSGNDTVSFKFNGFASEKDLNEKIILIDSTCNRKIEVNIKGKVINPAFSLNSVVIYSKPGETGTANALVINESEYELHVDSIGIPKNQFKSENLFLPSVIRPGDTLKIEITYTADDLEKDNATIPVYFRECNVESAIGLTGIPLFSAYDLKTINLSAYAGELVKLPIIIDKTASNYDNTISEINLELNYNPTLLAPIDYDPVEIDKYNSKIHLKKLYPANSQNDTLLIIPFIAGLGNAESCELILSNVETIGGASEITTRNGSFTLLGICEDGGTRLINPNSRAGILSIAPNPASNKITFHVSLTEKGLTELAIYDIMGEKVKTVYEGFNSSDDLESSDEYINLSTDISDITSGHYIVVFKTPTYIESRQISIIK